jgi:hypothetical protein
MEVTDQYSISLLKRVESQRWWRGRPGREWCGEGSRLAGTEARTTKADHSWHYDDAWTFR